MSADIAGATSNLRRELLLISVPRRRSLLAMTVICATMRQTWLLKFLILRRQIRHFSES